MSNRRMLFKSMLAGLVGLLPFRVASAQQGSVTQQLSERHIVSLEDQLSKGLRITTVAQQTYIRQIVQLVELGRLPRAMVNLLFTWARQRNPKVPFPYFQYALRALAKRRGIAVP
ncbi:MAG: hypothetical protein AAF483_15300 [Planctomycetota bacterium]